MRRDAYASVKQEKIMYKFLAATFFILIISASAFAQNKAKADDAKDALAVVNKLFDLITAHKPDEIIALHTPESQLVALIKGKTARTEQKFYRVKRSRNSSPSNAVKFRRKCMTRKRAFSATSRLFSGVMFLPRAASWRIAE